MKSCLMEQRLTKVTPEEIRQEVMEVIRQLLKDERDKRQISALVRRSGVSQTEINRIMRDRSHGINLYTATQILGALGKRLVVVDE